MKKNNAVQTAPKHSMLANQAPVPQKSKVSSQMTLSDSILSGAVVEFRKAGYRFMRHLHTNIEIYRILSGECYVAYALNYIQEHYTTKILQEDIAQQLQISVRYLSKIFKSYMGVTLSNYITIYRVNRSIALMQSTDLTLTEIALQVGFRDSQQYSKVFMSVINATPSQYRKAILK